MSNNLFKTLKWLSDIRLVPMEQANLLSCYPDEHLIFELHENLDSYGFTMDDSVSQIFQKYFTKHISLGLASQPEMDRVFGDVLKLDREPALFAQKLVEFQEERNLREMDSA